MPRSSSKTRSVMRPRHLQHLLAMLAVPENAEQVAELVLSVGDPMLHAGVAMGIFYDAHEARLRHAHAPDVEIGLTLARVLATAPDPFSTITRDKVHTLTITDLNTARWDLAALAGLTALRSLELRGMPGQRLQLAPLPQLHTVSALWSGPVEGDWAGLLQGPELWSARLRVWPPVPPEALAGTVIESLETMVGTGSPPLSAFSKMPRLTALTLGSWAGPGSLRGVETLAGLQHLTLQCDRRRRPVGSAPSGFTDWEILQQVALQRLTLRNLPRFSTLSALAGMSVVSLELDGVGVEQTLTLAGLDTIRDLQWVSVQNSRTPDLDALHRLKTPLFGVTLDGNALVDGEQIADLQVETLGLTGGVQLQRLARLPTAALCPSLEGVLDLRDSHQLRSIAGIGALSGIEVLNLTRCSALEDLTGVERCPALRVVQLRGSGVRDLRPLEACANLERLEVSAGVTVPDFLQRRLRQQYYSARGLSITD